MTRITLLAASAAAKELCAPITNGGETCLIAATAKNSRKTTQLTKAALFVKSGLLFQALKLGWKGKTGRVNN